MTQDTNATLDLDLLPDVPDTGGAFKNYGKLSVSTKLFAWRNGKTEEVSRADWVRLPATADGKGAKGVEMFFKVDIQEFKPSLAFTYERKVTVGGADWNRIVVPSIEAILGKGTMAKDKQSATIQSLIGKYVAVEDTPQVPRKNAAPDAKVYNMIKFVKVYASRDECLKDVSEGFSSTGASNGSVESDPNVPSGWGKEDWLSMKNDPKSGVATLVSAALKQAEDSNKGKPKPVQTRAMESAKESAIDDFIKQVGCTREQALALLES